MAPRSEAATVHCYSSVVKSHDANAILVEAGGFTPVRWFFENGMRLTSACAEPPAKRSRLSIDEQQTSKDTGHLDSSKHLLLFELDLNLKFECSASSLLAQSPEANTLEQSITVQPFEVIQADNCTTLSMKLAQHKSPILSVHCAEFPERIAELMRNSLYIQRNTPAMSRRLQEQFEIPASLLSCSLSRSNNTPYHTIHLHASVHWISGISAFVSGVPRGGLKYYPDYAILIEAFPNHAMDERDNKNPWTPHDFYGSVHMPSKEGKRLAAIANVLNITLYPFQERAVNWLLQREGVKYSGNCIVSIQENDQRVNRVEHFTVARDLQGQECYVDHFRGIVSRRSPDDSISGVSGGILAEEMGLGKTVEIIALIKIHRRYSPTSLVLSKENRGDSLLTSKATLIITPASIVQQWKSEIERHAPSLRVLHYQGVPSGKNHMTESAQLISQMATEYDIVLTTYSTLSKELHFAEDPPQRDMRHAPRFERKRSPLVQIQWWRICLDEAQMVESGVTAAARVACRLPRVHSWAVSGTPLRREAHDLRGLLIFLRFQPYCTDSALWDHLIRNHKYLFRKIFSTIALRHTKSSVRSELILPPQKRIVINMPFTVTEEQNYKQLFSNMCNEIGLNDDGSPWRDDWDPDDPAVIEAMRSWLSRLRQTCLHPNVGRKNRKALGRSSRPLQTTSEVLDALIGQIETSLREKERLAITLCLTRAHILGNNGSDVHRSEKALAAYEEATTASAHVLEEARARLANAISAPNTQQDCRQDENPRSSDPVNDVFALLGILRSNVRHALQLHHTCTFFAATSCYQMKTDIVLTIPSSDRFKELEAKEDLLYDIAKTTRKSILHDASRKVEASMKAIQDGLCVEMPFVDVLRYNGIRSQRIGKAAKELCDAIQNLGQLIVQMRSNMMDYLLKPLVDRDDDLELTGGEYEESTKQQDELYVYFDAYKTVIADLHTFLTGESNPLIDHESKMIIQAARRFLDPEDPDAPPVHAPELALRLFDKRNATQAQKNQLSSLKILIEELKTLDASNLDIENSYTSSNEHALAQGLLTTLQRSYADHIKISASLQRELELFRSAQNQRVEFYRQLQEISDNVIPYKEELDNILDERALNEVLTKEESNANEKCQLKMKHRFLLTTREESESQVESKICIICRNAFMRGTLTVCGHQYCAECLDLWWKAHRTCPICKRQLKKDDIYDIVLRLQTANATVESNFSENHSRTHTANDHEVKSSIYADVDSTLMREIRAIDLPISYGTKIDTLGRHLKWLREHEPGVKSIIFSQYREFLDVLSIALTQFKIGVARLGRTRQAAEQFKLDKNIDCLLLDAKTDSSGLTLVNATHVFICEPLIQTAVELQAIARIHRIGQTKPTTVWMYLVSDTIEESIYQVSVSRRWAHVQARGHTDFKTNEHKSSSRDGKGPLHGIKPTSDNDSTVQESAIEAANTEEVEQSAALSKLLVAGKSGGERVNKDDLWLCLFGTKRSRQGQVNF